MKDDANEDYNRARQRRLAEQRQDELLDGIKYQENKINFTEESIQYYKNQNQMLQGQVDYADKT